MVAILKLPIQLNLGEKRPANSQRLSRFFFSSWNDFSKSFETHALTFLSHIILASAGVFSEMLSSE